MLTLEQVKLLESKVESLIEMVKSLCAERDELKIVIQKKDERIDYLHAKVSTYEAEQEKIEERVVNALNQLDVFQSSVVHAKAILAQSTNSVKGQGVVSDGLVDGNDSHSDDSGSDNKSNSIESGNVDQQQSSSEATTRVEDNAEKHSNATDDSDKQMDIF